MQNFSSQKCLRQTQHAQFNSVNWSKLKHISGHLPNTAHESPGLLLVGCLCLCVVARLCSGSIVLQEHNKTPSLTSLSSHFFGMPKQDDLMCNCIARILHLLHLLLAATHHSAWPCKRWVRTWRRAQSQQQTDALGWNNGSTSRLWKGGTCAPESSDRKLCHSSCCKMRCGMG